MIKFGLKFGLFGIMGAALMGCSDGAARDQDSGDLKVTENNEVAYLGHANLIDRVNLFYNTDPSKAALEYEFSLAKIFTDEFPQMRDTLTVSKDEFKDITDELGFKYPDWGKRLYTRHLRPSNKDPIYDMPYIEDENLFAVTFADKTLPPLVGYCHANDVTARCRFTGMYDDQVPYLIQYDTPVGDSVDLIIKSSQYKFLRVNVKDVETFNRLAISKLSSLR